MPYIYGQLLVAQAENLTADPSVAPVGRFYFNTISNQWKFFDGGSWVTLSGGTSDAPDVKGTKASPLLITAAGGITTDTAYNQFQFVEGDGGPITIIANPQISAGIVVGTKLTLFFNNPSITLVDGSGLSLAGEFVGSLGRNIVLIWDGVTWTEISRT